MALVVRLSVPAVLEPGTKLDNGLTSMGGCVGKQSRKLSGRLSIWEYLLLYPYNLIMVHVSVTHVLTLQRDVSAPPTTTHVSNPTWAQQTPNPVCLCDSRHGALPCAASSSLLICFIMLLLLVRSMTTTTAVLCTTTGA